MATTELTGNELDMAGEARLNQAMRHFWHPVMYAAELGEKPESVRLLDEQLVVVRLAGRVRAFTDLCIHRGAALSLGWVEEGELRCPFHGWAYGPDGVCTKIPSRFGDNIPTKARIPAYQAAEKGGLIWVCLEAEPHFPLPEFPEFDDPRYRLTTIPAYEWDCSAARRLENYVDFAHFAWVHDGVLGDRNRPVVPDHDIRREGAELRMEVAMDEPVDNIKSKPIAGEAAEITAQKRYRIFMPYSVWLHQTLSEESQFVLFMSASPVSANRTRTFTFNARNYDLEGDDQKYIDFQKLIVEQDRPIVESQRPEELPVDLSAELHIRGVDLVSIEYRKWLIEIAGALQKSE